MRTISTTRARIVGPAFLAVLLTLGACSSGGEDDATDDVATLGASTDEGDDDSDSGDDDGGGGQGGQGVDPEFQDAVIEFAECMREHGIDMPDPQFTEDGGVMIGAGAVAQGGDDGDGAEFPSETEIAEMDAANEACEPIMEEARGSMPEPDPEQLAEMQDQALEFAECMREHGIDFPDPVFDDGGGRMSVAIGGPGEGDAGGIDPSDEDFQEAAEECGGEGGFGFGPAMRVDNDDNDDEDDE